MKQKWERGKRGKERGGRRAMEIWSMSQPFFSGLKQMHEIMEDSQQKARPLSTL